MAPAKTVDALTTTGYKTNFSTGEKMLNFDKNTLHFVDVQTHFHLGLLLYWHQEEFFPFVKCRHSYNLIQKCQQNLHRHSVKKMGGISISVAFLLWVLEQQNFLSHAHFHLLRRPCGIHLYTSFI